MQPKESVNLFEQQKASFTFHLFSGVYFIKHYKDPINGKYPAGFLLPPAFNGFPSVEDPNIGNSPLRSMDVRTPLGKPKKNNKKKEKLRKRLGGGMRYTPKKLSWNLKMEVWKMKFLFKGVIFRWLENM